MPGTTRLICRSGQAKRSRGNSAPAEPSARRGTDHLGDALAVALSRYNEATMQDACDAVVAELERLAQEYDTGSLSSWSNAAFAYFDTTVLGKHCVLEVKKSHQPLI